MTSFLRQLSAAARMLLALTLICGVVYPLVILGVGQVVAKNQANGSLVHTASGPVGSSLIGQAFTEGQWFHGRPSASDYAGNTSGGSNLGPLDDRQRKAMDERRAALLDANPHASGSLPADALTASASGLDPDVSAAYAMWQVPRVAKARSLPEVQVRQLVLLNTQGRIAGFLGQPRVNVLELNLALESQLPN